MLLENNDWCRNDVSDQDYNVNGTDFRTLKTLTLRFQFTETGIGWVKFDSSLNVWK